MRYPDEFPIAQLDLSPREVNACQEGGIKTIGDLRKASHTRLMRLPGVGHVTANDLLDRIPGLESGWGASLDPVYDILVALARVNEAISECGLTPIIRDNQILLLKELT